MNNHIIIIQTWTETVNLNSYFINLNKEGAKTMPLTSGNCPWNSRLYMWVPRLCCFPPNWGEMLQGSSPSFLGWWPRAYLIYQVILHSYPLSLLLKLCTTRVQGSSCPPVWPVGCVQEECLDLPLAFRNGVFQALLSWGSLPSHGSQALSSMSRVAHLFIFT